VGIALVGLTAVAFILTGLRRSGASSEDARVGNAEASYEMAVGEVLLRGPLGAEALAELDALDQQFARSTSAMPPPAVVTASPDDAEGGAAAEYPRRQTTELTPEHSRGAFVHRASEPIAAAATIGGSNRFNGEESTSSERVGAIRGGVERLYSPRAAAEYLQVHVTTVRRWVRLGRLPASRLAGGRRFRIRESDLLGLLDPFEPDAEQR
jgi:excisionase family DNA binding protein